MTHIRVNKSDLPKVEQAIKNIADETDEVLKKCILSMALAPYNTATKKRKSLPSEVDIKVGCGGRLQAVCW